MAIGVFQINEAEWWAAESLEDALTASSRETGIPIDEIEDDYTRALSYSEMRDLKFKHEDGRKESFEDHLKSLISSGQEFPCIFAIHPDYA